MTFFALENLCR